MPGSGLGPQKCRLKSPYPPCCVALSGPAPSLSYFLTWHQAVLITCVRCLAPSIAQDTPTPPPGPKERQLAARCPGSGGARQLARTAWIQLRSEEGMVWDGAARRASIALSAEQPLWPGLVHRPGPQLQRPGEYSRPECWAGPWGAHLPSENAGHTDVQGLAPEDDPRGTQVTSPTDHRAAPRNTRRNVSSAGTSHRVYRQSEVCDRPAHPPAAGPAL